MPERRRSASPGPLPPGRVAAPAAPVDSPSTTTSRRITASRPARQRSTAHRIRRAGDRPGEWLAAAARVPAAARPRSGHRGGDLLRRRPGRRDADPDQHRRRHLHHRPARGPDPAARRTRRRVPAAGERDRRARADPHRTAVRRRHPAGGPGGGREAAQRAVDPGRHRAGRGTGHPDADRRSQRQGRRRRPARRGGGDARRGRRGDRGQRHHPGGRLLLVRRRRARAWSSTASRSAGRSRSR